MAITTLLALPERVADGLKCLPGDRQRPLDVLLRMRGGQEPIVRRVEVDAVLDRLAREEQGARDGPILQVVGIEAQEGKLCRPGLCDLQAVLLRLVGESRTEH